MPTADDPCDQRIHLEAVDAARNIARRYHILVQRDLFGAFIVEQGWGRIGARGQIRRHAFDTAAEARRLVHQLLRRRASAERRIGVAYRRA